MTANVASMTSTQEKGTDWSLYGRIAWRLIPILFLVQVVGFLDRVNVGFAKLQMQADLGLSNAAYGLGAGVFFIGYFIFEIPSNILLNRVGAKVWFARILITWGLATVAMAWVKDEFWFYVLRFLVGAAEAGFAPGTQLYFSQWFPSRFRGRINGLFLISIPLSVVIGGPLGGFILGHMNHVGGYAGWQWLFIILGVVSVALAPVLLWILPSRLSNATWLTEVEQRRVATDITKLSENSECAGWREMFKLRKTQYLTVIYFLMLCGNYGVAFWMPQIIKNTGIADPMTVGWLSAIPYLAAMICMLIVSRLSDKSDDRAKYMVLCGVLAAAGLALTAFAIKDTTLAITGMAMAASGILSSVPIFWAIAARMYSGSAATVGFAFINSIGNLGGFVSPYMIGLIADSTGSPLAGLYTLSGFEVFAVLMLAFLIRERRANAQ